MRHRDHLPRSHCNQTQPIISRDHLSFLRSLKLSLVYGDFFFVDAGARPRVSLTDQSEADMLDRQRTPSTVRRNFRKFIVHCHTPVREFDIRPNRIDIYTGACATGKLTLLTIQGDSIMVR